ncbi:PIG-L family deacetylase [Candidatus Peregrinibacteria bacterium]|nr:PIG-L family deacetylase [Candidatus Peregrinibacteria bacterium]
MKVVVVAPHPDDETLGCGGTLLKHRDQGDEINWLIMTYLAEESGYSAAQRTKRNQEIKAVKKAYQFHEVVELNLATTKLDIMPTRDLTLKIREVFEKLQPEVVYLPFPNDGHSDHLKTFSVIYNCAKTFRFPFVKKILAMETISETEFAPQNNAVFSPNFFVDITKYIDKKLEIMRKYESEIGERPMPRSLENIRALATYRGSTANCMYAESFMILKEIW